MTGLIEVPKLVKGFLHAPRSFATLRMTVLFPNTASKVSAHAPSRGRQLFFSCGNLRANSVALLFGRWSRHHPISAARFREVQPVIRRRAAQSLCREHHVVARKSGQRDHEFLSTLSTLSTISHHEVAIAALCFQQSRHLCQLPVAGAVRIAVIDLLKSNRCRSCTARSAFPRRRMRRALKAVTRGY